jgi:hypothetical protein
VHVLASPQPRLAGVTTTLNLLRVIPSHTDARQPA